jgi:hypothetical protein
MTGCTTCGAALAPAPPPPGTLTPVWAHVAPPDDDHMPGVPPVAITYRHAGDLWDAECTEVPGFPVRGAVSLAEAKAIAWALLGKLAPPRPVAEHVPA